MALYSFSSVGLLCFATSLMVAVVSGISPYHSRPLASVAGAGSRGDSRPTFNRYYAENAAARSMQAESCPVRGAHEFCHTADLESDFQVHICPTDGSPCDQLLNVCYYTSVPPCCPDTRVGLECKSVTTVPGPVEGKSFIVTHYRSQLSDEICVSISPAVKICDEACRTQCRHRPCLQNLECDSNGTNCQCREGFTEESECCTCEFDTYYKNDTRCIKFCRDNCRIRAPPRDENGRLIGECTKCSNGYEPPTCCNCSSDLVEANDGICKCIINTFPNGSCIAGAQPQNCCLCATDYKKNPDTGKCEPEKCDKNQTLYFYIDATRSNRQNFCPLIVVMQMLVAAFNPSSTSGTKINALLFPDIPRSKDPSHVFNSSTTCLEAIQGQNGSLRLLLSEFGVCLSKSKGRFAYNSRLFPSSCGEGTSAVKGLEEIYRLASSRNSSGSGSTESAVLMLTDGLIEDDNKGLTTVLQNLNSVGVRLIAAGINNGSVDGANRGNLRSYTSNDSIVIEKDPITLGEAIVRKLEEREIICKEHADNITASLENVQEDEITVPGGKVSTLSLFCRCHRIEPNPNCAVRTIKYPTCGGDLSIGVPLATTQEAKLDSLILEEEILAAVESVLERFEG